MTKRIGTLGEKSLHAALKNYYAQPGDLVEHTVNGYVIDIVRDQGDSPGLCIEIQTRGFVNMKRKLLALLDDYQVRVVYPIARQRTIRRLAANGSTHSSRRSPKHGTPVEVFQELVSFPALIQHPHFSLELLLVSEEQVWIDDGAGSWRRRRWSILDRRLLAIDQSLTLASAADCAALLPIDLPAQFDCRQLAEHLHQPHSLAQKMAYCLRTMGQLQVTGKRGNALVYQRQPANNDNTAV